MIKQIKDNFVTLFIIAAAIAMTAANGHFVYVVMADAEQPYEVELEVVYEADTGRNECHDLLEVCLDELEHLLDDCCHCEAQPGDLMVQS